MPLPEPLVYHDGQRQQHDWQQRQRATHVVHYRFYAAFRRRGSDLLHSHLCARRDPHLLCDHVGQGKYVRVLIPLPGDGLGDAGRLQQRRDPGAG